MKTALILHGTCDREEFFSEEYPSLSNSHWLPWLQKQLIINGYAAHTPEMPLAYAPDYALWKTEFERYAVNHESLLIGHSCGGGFLLRWLSENPVPIRRLILVAPWLDPDRMLTSGFFEFKIDPQIISRTELHLLHSDNDSNEITKSIEMIRAALPGIHDHPFHGFGHFCFGDMGTEAFPQLSDIALNGCSELSFG